MVERVQEEKKSSGVSKAALATAIGAGVVALGRGNGNGGGILGGLFGYPAGAPATAAAATTAAIETSVMLPLMMGAYGGAGRCGPHHGGDDFVTKENMGLIRENNAKDAEIAQLKSERFTLEYVDRKTAITDQKIDALNNRACNLETQAAVNAARDQDFRRYVEREFVHQPKATIRESIVVCQQCGCNNGSCGCGHNHGC